MAITLVATPGSASANTYCTLSEANTYFQSRLHKTTWENAGSGDKNIALAWATRLLDEKVNWKGTQVEEDGALRWPRYYVYNLDGTAIDETTIPGWLKNATAEFALHLLAADRTLETNRDLTGFKSVKVDVIEIEMDSMKVNAAKPVLPPSVWSIVKFYGSLYGQAKTLVRA